MNGDKRVAVHAMLVYLAVNNIIFDYSQEDIFELSMKIADDNMEPPEIVAWLEAKYKNACNTECLAKNNRGLKQIAESRCQSHELVED